MDGWAAHIDESNVRLFFTAGIRVGVTSPRSGGREGGDLVRVGVTQAVSEVLGAGGG